MTDTTLALPSAGGEQPRQVLPLAALFVASGVLMFYAALLGAYVQLRSGVHEWPPEGAPLDQYLGNMLVITIALSAVTVEWAAAAVRRGLQRQASAAYGITVGLGLAFLLLLSHTAGHVDYGAASHEYATVVTALGMVNGVFVALGIAFAVLTLFRVRGGQVSAAEPGQARAAAWYWHATVVTVTAAWYTIVILK